MLDGLVFEVGPSVDVDWNSIFEVLSKSSPVNLFKFKINTIKSVVPSNFDFFFKNWKNGARKPMILKTVQVLPIQRELIGRYKSEGVIQFYENNLTDLEEFEWI